jgi:hypothetical protein
MALIGLLALYAEGPPCYSPNLDWHAVDSAVPVTIEDMRRVVAEITFRRQALFAACGDKKHALDGLETIEQVIAYDAGAGWPS